MRIHFTTQLKFLATVIFSLFITKFSFAQIGDVGSCNIANALCGYNLSDTIPGLQIASKTGINAIIYGRTGAGFKDIQYGSELRVESCGTDTSTDNCFSDTSVLRYEVYYPSNYPYYNTCPLYPIVMFHGGSFTECSDLSNDGIGKMCMQLAKRGFVVFNVEYRRGLLIDRDVVPNALLVTLNILLHRDGLHYTEAYRMQEAQ